MFKLANQMLDQYDDVLKEHIVKLAKVNPKIYLNTPEEHAKIAEDDFALSVITKKAHKLNKFPIDTHDNTWLSNHYFELNHEKLSEKAASVAAYHIKKACEKFNIKALPAVEGFAKEASSNIFYDDERSINNSPIQVKEVDFSKFASVQNIGDNYTFAQYVMSTPAHVKVASKYFDQYSDKMPVEYRHKYAAAIQKRASELGMQPVKGKTIKYASDHYSSALDAHIRSRVGLVEFSNPEYAQHFTKLGSMKDQLSPNDFAKVLHTLDKKAGLAKHYGSYLTDPFLATLGLPPSPKAWQSKTASVTLTADDVSKLANEKYAKVKEYFGPHVADELKKQGMPIFESLPKDAQEVIAGIANGSL